MSVQIVDFLHPPRDGIAASARLKKCFADTKQYFNEVLKNKLTMYLVDKEALEINGSDAEINIKQNIKDELLIKEGSESE